MGVASRRADVGNISQDITDRLIMSEYWEETFFDSNKTPSSSSRYQIERVSHSASRSSPVTKHTISKLDLYNTAFDSTLDQLYSKLFRDQDENFQYAGRFQSEFWYD